ncbi:MAG: hypothetical protein ACKO37_07010 [Vampirovibrionales bacterium]
MNYQEFQPEALSSHLSTESSLQPPSHIMMRSNAFASSPPKQESNHQGLWPNHDNPPRWYDKIQRLSYSFSVFREFKHESPIILSEVLKEEVGGKKFRDRLQDKIQRLEPEQLFVLYQQQNNRRRWYDQSPVLKRYMTQLVPLSDQEKVLAGDKLLGMSLLMYQFYMQADSDTQLHIPNRQELCRMMKTIYGSPQPLMALETMYKDDLAMVMAGHLQHRHQLEYLPQENSLILVRYSKKPISIMEMLRPNQG